MDVENRPKIGCVVMAAGNARRFGDNKLAAQLRDCDGVLFQVSDQPLLRRESVAELADRWQARPEKIAALGHGGVRGNPCLFPARFFPELLELREDHGGNTVIRRHEEDLFLLEVPAEELHDVDTVQALEELKAEAAR